MKRHFLALGILTVFSISIVYSQKIVNETQVVLTSAQKKHDPAFSILNQKTGGITVFFEPEPAPYTKGERRKFERYEIQLDKDLNLFSGDFKILETKYSLYPKFLFNDCSISYYTWVDHGSDSKVNKMMLQIIKFDQDLNIAISKSYELCDEKGFESYKIASNNGNLFILVQYQKKPANDKNHKNKTILVYKRIDVSTLDIIIEMELNLLGNDELGLETILIEKDKLFLAGPLLFQVDSGGVKIPKTWFVFRLNLDGTQDKHTEITIPGNSIGSVFLTIKNDNIYLAGEYGDPNEMKKIILPPYGASDNITVKCINPYLGIYVKKLDADLNEKSSKTFSYKDDVLPKLKNGNKSFIKKSADCNFQNFYFLDDGSFYLTAEMYTKAYRTVLTTNDFYNNYTNYTDYNYMDGLVFKFNSNQGLDWLVQIDRDNYTKVYQGFMMDKKPQENGKLESYLLPDSKLAVMYNTPGRKYSVNRFGMSEITVTPLGVISKPFEITSEQEFELLDGGIVGLGNNEILAVGTNAKTNNIWIKKIKLFE